MSGKLLKISGEEKDLSSLPKGGWSFEKRPGGWWIAKNDKGRRVRFQSGRFGQLANAVFRGNSWFGEYQKPTWGGAGSDSGDEKLIAEFPGKIRKVLVKSGQAVEKGQDLVLIEAMKMEMAISAPYSGTVKKILVKDGGQILPGDRFLEIEAEKIKDK